MIPSPNNPRKEPGPWRAGVMVRTDAYCGPQTTLLLLRIETPAWRDWPVRDVSNSVGRRGEYQDHVSIIVSCCEYTPADQEPSVHRLLSVFPATEQNVPRSQVRSREPKSPTQAATCCAVPVSVLSCVFGPHVMYPSRDPGTRHKPATRDIGICAEG